MKESYSFHAEKRFQRTPGQYYMMDSVVGVLKNLKKEIEAGLITSLADEASGEVYGDFLG